MQMLAGIITEEQYKAKLNEDGGDVESIINNMLPNLEKEGYIENNIFYIDFDEIGNFWHNVFEKAYGHEHDDLNNDDIDKFDNIQQLTLNAFSKRGLNVKFEY